MRKAKIGILTNHSVMIALSSGLVARVQSAEIAIAAIKRRVVAAALRVRAEVAGTGVLVVARCLRMYTVPTGARIIRARILVVAVDFHVLTLCRSAVAVVNSAVVLIVAENRGGEHTRAIDSITGVRGAGIIIRAHLADVSALARGAIAVVRCASTLVVTVLSGEYTIACRASVIRAFVVITANYCYMLA